MVGTSRVCWVFGFFFCCCQTVHDLETDDLERQERGEMQRSECPPQGGRSHGGARHPCRSLARTGRCTALHAQATERPPSANLCALPQERHTGPAAPCGVHTAAVTPTPGRRSHHPAVPWAAHPAATPQAAATAWEAAATTPTAVAMAMVAAAAAAAARRALATAPAGMARGGRHCRRREPAPAPAGAPVGAGLGAAAERAGPAALAAATAGAAVAQCRLWRRAPAAHLCAGARHICAVAVCAGRCGDLGGPSVHRAQPQA